MVNIIDEIEKEEVENKRMPRIKSGDIVRIVQSYQEKEKERHAVFEGMVIAVNSGAKTRRTITVRRAIDGVGVEKIYPLYLSNIVKITVLKSSKVRRSKLYYLRNLSGKKARLREKGLDKEVIELMAAEEEEHKKVKKTEERIKPKAKKPEVNAKKEKENDAKEQKTGK
jgi:large subunit ribosomal protein L19